MFWLLFTGDGQSVERPCELKLVQGEPWFGLPSHTPVQGELGVPAHAGPLVEPERQIGQG